MTARDFVRVLQQRWVTVVLGTIAGLGVAIVYFVVTPAQYTATSTLYVSAQVGTSPQQAYQGAQLSEQRVKSYTELATGPRVLGEVIRELGLHYGERELAERVTATSAVDSVVIEVSAVDDTPAGSAAIARRCRLDHPSGG